MFDSIIIGDSRHLLDTAFTAFGTEKWYVQFIGKQIFSHTSSSTYWAVLPMQVRLTDSLAQLPCQGQQQRLSTNTWSVLRHAACLAGRGNAQTGQMDASIPWSCPAENQ